MIIKIERIRSQEKIISLHSDLYDRATNKSFFLSPHWFSCWIQNHPSLNNAFSIQGYSDTRLNLLAVMTIRTGIEALLHLNREAYFNETGDQSADLVCIENNDFLLGSGAPLSARALALEAITRWASADELVFRRTSEELKQCAEQISVTAGYRYRELDSSPTFEIDLRRGAKGWNSDSAQTRIRQSVSEYEKRGALTVSMVKCQQERESVLETLIELHNKRWGEKGNGGLFSNKRFLSFHRALLGYEPGGAHLIVCKAGASTIGVLYNFVEGSRILNYQSGFLYEGDNRIRPGYVSHSLAAKLYSEKGYDRYNLLAGDARYKKELGVAAETLYSFVLEKRSTPSHMRNMIRSLKKRNY